MVIIMLTNPVRASGLYASSLYAKYRIIWLIRQIHLIKCARIVNAILFYLVCTTILCGYSLYTIYVQIVPDTTIFVNFCEHLSNFKIAVFFHADMTIFNMQ